MKNYNYRDIDLFSGSHLTGLMLVAAGAYIEFDTLFGDGGTVTPLGKSQMTVVVLLIIGLILLSSYRGVQIDFQENRIKRYFSLGVYKLGQWEKLPKIMKVSLASFSYSTTNTPNGISPTLSGRVTDYRVFLYMDGHDTPVHTFIYTKKARALKEARCISEGFDVDFDIGE